MNYYHKTIHAIIIACFTLLIVTPTAHALTVSPPKMEIAGDPGQTITPRIKLLNEERESKKFYITYQNFEAKDENGAPVFTGNKTDLASWMSGPTTVTLGPLERQDFTFTIHIPKDADTGGHFVAVVMQDKPPTELGGGNVAIGGDVGSLVLLTVNGAFTEQADVVEFDTKNHKHFFTSLPIDLFYRFQNVGQDRIKPLGDIIINNWYGGKSKVLPANDAGGNVLPHSIRKFETSWLTNKGEVEDVNAPRPPEAPKGFFAKAMHEWKYWAFGRYKANLLLVYGATQTVTKAQVVFWVIPWHFLLIAIPGLLILLIILYVIIKRYNRYIVRQSQRR